MKPISELRMREQHLLRVYKLAMEEKWAANQPFCTMNVPLGNAGKVWELKGTWKDFDKVGSH